MRTASLSAAAALFLAATPAFATNSIHCRTAPRGPELWIGVGTDQATGIFQARLADGRQEMLTGTARGGPRLAASHVDPRRLSLRINVGRTRVATLQAAKRGTPYVGSLVYRGRTWPVRCFWDEDDEGQ
jgi:hypothetical protein